MLEKIPKILFTITGIMLLAVIIYFFIQKSRQEIIIKTPDKKISVNNPTKVPNSKSLSAGGVEFKKNPNYSISYYPENSGFIISIASPNIQLARNEAEKDFLQTLNVSQEDACKLTVSLSVPFRVNENASGADYHLSFCPNGKAFPN